ncbi:hypothetical protein [Streptomyces cinnamoneus]|uniref:hypothetical protein n=1 Tax=Streptomyces cinnamoneus TaxID=53446 RepID=UPI001EFC7E18|nr:hypothetical protein [Streptomyces cinnamoneus]
MLRGAAAAAEVLGWWAGLTACWAVLISTLEPLDLQIGAGAALLAALAARGARRAAAR